MFLIEIIHRLFYDTWVLYIDLLFLYILFSTSRFSKLVSFTFDLVHSLSTWFIHSFIYPLFKLGIVLALLTSGGLLWSSSDEVIMLVRHPLDCFSFMSIYYLFFMTSSVLYQSVLFQICKLFYFCMFSWVGSVIMFTWWWLVWWFAWISRKGFLDICL